MYARFVKPLLDRIGALAGLLVLAPVLLITALLVRLYIGSPVLFRQERPGWRGAPFILLKFRTMSDARDASGQVLPDDQRLGKLGRRLRASSLDELPELVNILRGDMSFVGPRPLLMQYLPLYSKEQARRHEVKPGLTGWAQVNGRNAMTWDAKFAHDRFYVDHLGWRLDLKILALTVLKVFRQEGISQPGHETTEYFKGNRE